MLGAEPAKRVSDVIRLSAETEEESWEVERLYDLCFAPGREGLSSYRLREGVPPVAELCRLARDEFGQLAGAIRFWPVRVGGAEALLLGPVAVHPTRQGEGVGARLIWEGLETAARLEAARILLVGDAPFYTRFGFERLEGVHMPPPTNPERVLGRGDWAGVTGDVTRFS